MSNVQHVITLGIGSEPNSLEFFLTLGLTVRITPSGSVLVYNSLTGELLYSYSVNALEYCYLTNAVVYSNTIDALEYNYQTNSLTFSA